MKMNDEKVSANN